MSRCVKSPRTFIFANGVLAEDVSDATLCLSSGEASRRPMEAAACSALLERDSFPENAKRLARRVAVLPLRIRTPRCFPDLRRGCAAVCLLHRRRARFRLFSAAKFPSPLYLSLHSLCPARECTSHACP